MCNILYYRLCSSMSGSCFITRKILDIIMHFSQKSFCKLWVHHITTRRMRLLKYVYYWTDVVDVAVKERLVGCWSHGHQQCCCYGGVVTEHGLTECFSSQMCVNTAAVCCVVITHNYWRLSVMMVELQTHMCEVITITDVRTVASDVSRQPATLVLRTDWAELSMTDH